MSTCCCYLVCGSAVKNLPAIQKMQETQVQSLGREDLLEEETAGGGNAAHSSTLAWKIPWKEEPSWLQSMGSQKSQTRLNM